MKLEALLVIISIIGVVLTTVIYQLIIELKKLPSQIAKLVMGDFKQKIESLSKEVKDIKNDMGMD